MVEAIPKHPRCISESCKAHILHVLAPNISVEFLDKLQGGNISNLNENLHGMIWNHVSKTKPVDLSLMRLDASLAVIRFNEGLAGIQNIINSLGLSEYISIQNLVGEFDNEIKIIV